MDGVRGTEMQKNSLVSDYKACLSFGPFVNGLSDPYLACVKHGKLKDLIYHRSQFTAALSAQDPAVRLLAVFLLYEYWEPAPSDVPSLEALIESDNSALVRGFAIRCLLKLPREVLPQTLRALMDIVFPVKQNKRPTVVPPGLNIAARLNPLMNAKGISSPPKVSEVVGLLQSQDRNDVLLGLTIVIAHEIHADLPERMYREMRRVVVESQDKEGKKIAIYALAKMLTRGASQEGINHGKRLFSTIVTDENEENDVREEAYKGLLVLHSISIVSYTELLGKTELAFPSDVDWEFVASCAQNAS